MRTAFDYVNWAMIGLVIVWMVAFLFLEIFSTQARLKCTAIVTLTVA